VHDVFVLQFAGEKHWRIHEPVLEAPLRTQPWTERAAAVAAAEGELRGQRKLCAANAPWLAPPWTAGEQQLVRPPFEQLGVSYAKDTFARVDAGLMRWRAELERVREQVCASPAPRAALAAEKAVRIRIDGQAFARLHAGAVGIGDARVCAAGILDALAQLDGAGGIEGPGMPQVEIGEIPGHARGVGQARSGIFLGELGDGAGLVQRGLDRIGVEVGRTGRALALAEVHGEAEAAVAGVLHRLHLAQAHVHAQPGVDAGGYLGLAGAGGAGAADDVLGEIGEAVEILLAAVGGNGNRAHMGFLKTGG